MKTRTFIVRIVVLGTLLVAFGQAWADSGIVRKFGSSGTPKDLEVVGRHSWYWREAMTYRVGEATNPNSYPDVVLDVFFMPDGTLIGEGRWDASTGNAQVHLGTPASGGEWVTVIIRSRYQPGSPSAPQTAIPLSYKFDRSSAWTRSAEGSFDLAEGPRIQTATLYNGTVVQTVQEPAGEGGTSDTMLMILQDDVPIAFDDDNGIERMSWLKLGRPCWSSSSHVCTILPMRRSNHPTDWYVCPTMFPEVTAGTATVVWDGDVANGRDRDTDGLGDALEIALGTCTDPNDPSKDKDSDGDGKKDCDDQDVDGDAIRDSFEVLGIFNWNSSVPKDPCARNLWKFPYYGADPTKRDLFVEVDWLPTCRGNPASCREGHPLPPLQDKDAWQWTPGNAETYVDRFMHNGYGPDDLHVHVDIGPWPATVMQDNYKRGNWGGAARVSDDVYLHRKDLEEELPDPNSPRYAAADRLWQEYNGRGFNACQGFGEAVQAGNKWSFTGVRFGMFHHAVSYWTDVPFNAGLGTAFCPDADQAIHETGHFFGMGHWGITNDDRPGSKTVCKLNYFTVVSYCGAPKSMIGSPGAKFPAFSHGLFTPGGQFGEVVLNPVRLDEGRGLGTTDRDVLNYVRAVSGRKVGLDSSRPDYGGVDWDDDGEIEMGTTVRAFLNHGAPQSSGEQAWMGDGGEWLPLAGDGKEFMTWDKKNFVGSDSMALYPDDTNEFGFRMRYAYWDGVAGRTSLGHLWPSRKQDCEGEFCEEFKSGWGTYTSHRVNAMVADKAMVVFQTTDGHLLYAGHVGNPPVYVEKLFGATKRLGPPAMVSRNGNFHIYAGNANVPSTPTDAGFGGALSADLHGFEIDPSTGTVSHSGQQYWADTGNTVVTIVPGSSVGITKGWVRFRDPVTNVETNKEEVVAAIPSADPTSGASRIELAILSTTSVLDPIANVWYDLYKWERQSDLGRDDPLAMIQASRRVPSVGRVGLAYLPDDPANPSAGGRYYMTWQWRTSHTDKNGKIHHNEVPLVALSRGNRLPVDGTCTKAHGLCFPSFGRFSDGGTNWPAGVSLAYAGGHLRGLVASGAGEGGNRYFPHADGIVDIDQKDFNDWQHIRKKFECILRHCPWLTK